MPLAQKLIYPAKIWATVQTIHTVLSEGVFKIKLYKALEDSLNKILSKYHWVSSSMTLQSGSLLAGC